MPSSATAVIQSFLADIATDSSGAFPAESLVEGLAAGAGTSVDPNVELSFVGPDYSGNRLTYRGIEAAAGGWRDWGEAHESYRLVPGEVIEIKDGALFLGRGLTRTRRGGVEMEHEAAAIFRIRDGTIVAVELYLDWDQARGAAGLAPDS
jgi:ketosteroid isomerase-like protein